jgi:hypothetical protein
MQRPVAPKSDGPGVHRRRTAAAAASMVALVAVLVLSAAVGAAAQPRVMPKKEPKKCGGIGAKCCPQCPPDTPLTGELTAQQVQSSGRQRACAYDAQGWWPSAPALQDCFGCT